MAFKAYFDAGNQADSEAYDALTLAGMSGTEEDWSPFENDWKDVLKRHGAAHHARTAAAGNDGQHPQEVSFGRVGPSRSSYTTTKRKGRPLRVGASHHIIVCPLDSVIVPQPPKFRREDATLIVPSDILYAFNKYIESCPCPEQQWTTTSG